MKSDMKMLFGGGVGSAITIYIIFEHLFVPLSCSITINTEILFAVCSSMMIIFVHEYKCDFVMNVVNSEYKHMTHY